MKEYPDQQHDPGTSSCPEKVMMDGPLSLFESVQELAEQLNLSKEKITVKPYTRSICKWSVIYTGGKRQSK